MQVQLDPQKGAESPDIGVYAEIGGVKSSFSYTQNLVYGTSNSLPAEPQVSPTPSLDHDYDDAKLVQPAARECSEPYRVYHWR